MRVQHPSGRPVRSPIKSKRREPVWNCPLMEPATPRLRPAARVSTYAVGFQQQPRTEEWWNDTLAVGFVHFKPGE